MYLGQQAYPCWRLAHSWDADSGNLPHSPLIPRYRCLSYWYIRLGRGNRPNRHVESGLVTENGAVFQIDGNLGFLAGVNEMLLQSRYRYPRSEAWHKALASCFCMHIRAPDVS